MNKLNRFTNYLIITLLILFTLFQTTHIVYAQENEQLEIKGLKYQMYEYAEKIDQVNQTQSIGIELPSHTWDVTNLELNFTDIKIAKETKEFEVYDTGFKVIEKFGKNYGYAVQINISEPTRLYGTYIYGFKNDLASATLSVQINGYNPFKNAPNETIYGNPTSLNITEDLGWHYQNFKNPIDLSVGKYFLVIDGSNVSTSQDRYYWGYNAYPQYPNLHISKYDGFTWSDGVKNNTLLYKLIQSVERIYNPQDLNMTIEIENTYYNIMNGKDNGTGYVKIPKLNYSPNTNLLKIPIKNNISATLNFSYNCFLKIKNRFDADGSMILKLDQEIKWTIEPLINIIGCNYSVEFYYPDNWNNINVYRDGLIINSELSVIINLNEKCIHLESDSIISGATWMITATSSQDILDLNFPFIEFEPMQQLKFSIELTQFGGYISWRLIDPWDFEEFSETKVVNSTLMTFTYQIPENPREGDYNVIIFWYNDYRASVISQSIKVTVPYTLDPQFIIIIVIIIGMVIVVSIASYMTIKGVRNKIQRDRKKLIDKCMDLLNLNYFMLIDKESGLCVYEENFLGKNIDSALISGFLDAIRSFGIELTGSYQESKTMKLEYKDSKILMVEFKNFRLILIMKENPSESFFESITALSYDIDEKYGHLLANFDHDVTPFQGIKKFLEKHLNTSFLAPLRIVENKNVKLKTVEKNEYYRALNFMNKNSLDYFFTSVLLNKHEYEPSKIKAIFNLIEKNIFQPYNIERFTIPKIINKINKN